MRPRLGDVVRPGRELHRGAPVPHGGPRSASASPGTTPARIPTGAERAEAGFPQGPPAPRLGQVAQHRGDRQGASPQCGHAARASASPAGGPPRTSAGSPAVPFTARPPGASAGPPTALSAARPASASAMGCRKARGKNSSAAASQSSDAATAATSATGRPPDAAASSADIAAGSADSRPATARNRSVADAGRARTKRAKARPRGRSGRLDRRRRGGRPSAASTAPSHRELKALTYRGSCSASTSP